jgi:hypothetical protein
MLELNVLEENETLYFVALIICVSGLFNHVEKWHRLFGFLGCFKFLVLLNNCIAGLDLGLVSLNLILRKRNLANLIE